MMKKMIRVLGISERFLCSFNLLFFGLYCGFFVCGFDCACCVWSAAMIAIGATMMLRSQMWKRMKMTRLGKKSLAFSQVLSFRVYRSFLFPSVTAFLKTVSFGSISY